MESPLAARQLERAVPAPERVVSFTSLHRAGGEWRAELPDHDEGEASPDPGEPAAGAATFHAAPWPATACTKSWNALTSRPRRTTGEG